MAGKDAAGLGVQHDRELSRLFAIPDEPNIDSGRAASTLRLLGKACSSLPQVWQARASAARRASDESAQGYPPKVQHIA
jgi:hypothetical protein